jgi:hypothetical protein
MAHVYVFLIVWGLLFGWQVGYVNWNPFLI